MKYKDIQVGEWFGYGSHIFIKTQHPTRGYLNIRMESNLGFGENWGHLDDEMEVNYIAHEKVDYPFMWEREETLGIAVDKVPFCVGNTISIKDTFKDKTLICVIATDCDGIYPGYWITFNKEMPIRYTNHFEYKVLEST